MSVIKFVLLMVCFSVIRDTEGKIVGCPNNEIALKTHHGKYVSAHSNGGAYANSKKIGNCETFTVEHLGNGKISLKSCLGKYLVAEDKRRGYQVNANRAVRGAWEMFTVQRKQRGKISLKGHHNRYVVAESSGHLKADRIRAGKWETFVPQCVKGQSANFKVTDIKDACNYDDLCFTCSCLLVGVDGHLVKYETYTTGYIETAIKVTKNYSGPKIQYLAEAGLFKIHSGEKLSEVDFTLFGTMAYVHYSATGAGYVAVAKLAGGSVSIFDLQLALGVSSEVGIVDDSLSVKLAGTGVKIGRKTQICVFDSCFGIDFGKLG